MTFGYELEFKGPFLCDLAEFMGVRVLSKFSKVNYEQFNLMKEVGITDEKLCGGELISPIYTDLDDCLKELIKKLELLIANDAYIPFNSFNTGFHVHVGKDILKTRLHYENLLKFLYAFEAEIYEFACYGKIIRANIWDNAHPLNFDDIIRFLSDYPYTSNFDTKKNAIRFTRETVEFRYFNSSLNYDDLKSVLYFVKQLCLYITSNSFDEELINYYFRNKDYIGRNYKIERDDIMRRELKI